MNLNVCAYVYKEKETFKVSSIDFEKEEITISDFILPGSTSSGIKTLKAFPFKDVYICYCNCNKEGLCLRRKNE